MTTNPNSQPRKISSQSLKKEIDRKFQAWVKRRHLEHEYPNYTMQNTIEAECAKLQREKKDKE